MPLKESILGKYHGPRDVTLIIVADAKLVRRTNVFGPNCNHPYLRLRS